VEFPHSTHGPTVRALADHAGARATKSTAAPRETGSVASAHGEIQHLAPALLKRNPTLRSQGGVAMVGMLVAATFAMFLFAHAARRRRHRA
jgi:hypothetical protein